jgi:hypothetical protein
MMAANLVQAVLWLPILALAAPTTSLHAFETRFHSLLPRSSNPQLIPRSSSGGAPIRLVGYKRVPVSAGEIQEFEARWNGKPAEWAGREEAHQSYNYFSHLWYDVEAKELRLYFPVSGGLVEHSESGRLIEADQWGQLPAHITAEHIAGPGGCPPSVVGRYQTANTTGVPGNFIKDGIIRLADPPRALRSADGDVYVFDFGVKVVHDHAHPHTHALDKSEPDDLRLRERMLEPAGGGGSTDGSVGGNDDADGEASDDGDNPEDGGGGCLANHGGENCSKAYGISEGRCPMDPATCMDYNGYSTDCKKGTTWHFGIPTFSKVIKFVGSDCSVSVLRGHCYNELM